MRYFGWVQKNTRGGGVFGSIDKGEEVRDSGGVNLLGLDGGGGGGGVSFRPCTSSSAASF